MGRAPCCDKANVKRGPWSPEEDAVLRSYVERNGTGGNWIALPQKAGLKRCGKSCRLRWLNYLRPDIKHGGFTEEEDNTILTLYNNIGSRWSVIASRLPGRTDNDVKNYWNTKLKKRLMAPQTTINPSTSLAPPPPPPHHLIQTIKSEASNISDFSLPQGDESLHPGFGLSLDAQRFFFCELAQFPFLELPGAGGGMSGYVEDGSAASSSNTMDNSSNSSYYADWCVNGAGADDWFMPKAGFGFGPGEFLGVGGYGYQERVGEVVAPRYSSILPDMRENAETKPQGLCYQGVTYS